MAQFEDLGSWNAYVPGTDMRGWRAPTIVTRPASPVITRQAASPSIRYGALRSPGNYYAGAVAFNPVNDSASPVIGAYSPYPTMLFAPRRMDSFAMMMDMMRNMAPRVDYGSFLTGLLQQAARTPKRGNGAARRSGGGGGGATTSEPLNDPIIPTAGMRQSQIPEGGIPFTPGGVMIPTEGMWQDEIPEGGIPFNPGRSKMTSQEPNAANNLPPSLMPQPSHGPNTANVTPDDVILRYPIVPERMRRVQQ